MKSRKKTLMTAAIVGIIAAIVIQQSGSVKVSENCRTFREEMRQIASSEAGLAGVLAVSESTMTQALGERYAGLKAEECTALMPQAAADMEAMTHIKWADQMPLAGEAARSAIKECHDKRLNGDLKTHGESAECSNLKMREALDKAGYPYKDLVEKLTAKRLELAQKLDKSSFDRAEDEIEFARLALDIAEAERARLKK